MCSAHWGRSKNHLIMISDEELVQIDKMLNVLKQFNMVEPPLDSPSNNGELDIVKNSTSTSISFTQIDQNKLYDIASALSQQEQAIKLNVKSLIRKDDEINLDIELTDDDIVFSDSA